MNFLICQNLFGGVHEQNVCSVRDPKVMFLLSPTFADTSLQEISFYSPLEEFLRDGHEDSVVRHLCPCEIDIAKVRHVAMPAFGKEFFNTGLAAQSFFFRKRIGCLYVHFIYLTGIFQELWRQMALRLSEPRSRFSDRLRSWHLLWTFRMKRT